MITSQDKPWLRAGTSGRASRKVVVIAAACALLCGGMLYLSSRQGRTHQTEGLPLAPQTDTAASQGQVETAQPPAAGEVSDLGLGDNVSRDSEFGVDSPGGSEFSALRRQVLERAPSFVNDLRSKRLSMDTANFGRSGIAELDALLDRHNGAAMALASIEFEAMADWDGNNPHKHTISLQRDGFVGSVACSGNSTVIDIRKGVALVHESWGPDFLDAYCLHGFSVFDPAEFTASRSDTIEVIDTDKQRTETIEVHRVESREVTLFFDKKDGRLARVSAHRPGETTEQVRVDLRTPLRIGKAVIPLDIEVTIFDKTGFRGEELPSHARWKIDKESISYEGSSK